MEIKQDYLSYFLPSSTCFLVNRIAKDVGYSPLDELTIILNLQYTIHKFLKGGIDIKELNGKSITFILINIIRISEKNLNSESKFSGQYLIDLLRNLKIIVDQKELDIQEFRVFKMMNFQIIESPELLQILHDWIYSVFADGIRAHVDEIWKVSLDVLIIIFMQREEMYKEQV